MKRLKIFSWLVGLAWLCAPASRASDATIAIITGTNAAPRVEFGAEHLAAAIRAEKLAAVVTNSAMLAGRKIHLDRPRDQTIPAEGYRFEVTSNQDLEIISSDDSGALYGCLDLGERIHELHQLPSAEIARVQSAPAMKLRGTCVGLQKTYLLPGRHVYEYPITPTLFPWFYDQALWTQYLDFLAQNRMNTLYLWSGHPFASLVRLKDYPYAVEVPEEVFRQNREMYHWLTRECDKRGIWLVQMFYNILVSKPFAETNSISTQLSAPTPLTADYTRQSIAQFVEDYPHIGLLVCLGEALRGTDHQLDWCTKVILPGVLEGMKVAGLKTEPPIVIRTHAMDPYAIMPPAYAVYSNLFTMTKYNGESLTTWEPRGKDQETHLAMRKLGPHVVNVHILSNLEPFRYTDVAFIKKCVQASRDRLGATGMHIYPLSYWNWPYSPDVATPAELQWERDWMWFEAWARYSWNPDVPETADRAYWISRLTEYYGNRAAAAKILAAGNEAGEVAPKLIRRLGITEGNRQTLSLGMTLDQLVNPKRYGAIPDLWESQAPPGERLDEYVNKEWSHKPHTGETPESNMNECLTESGQAVADIDAVEPLVTRHHAEYERLRNDLYCIQDLAKNYAAKTRAAELVLRYGYSHQISDLERAVPYLGQSLAFYQELARRATPAYHFANGMQTSQRKIPFSGGAGKVGTNYLWSQLLPLYQTEFTDFKRKVAGLSQGGAAVDESKIKPWPAAPFKLISREAETYPVGVGAKVFTDRNFKIQSLAPELAGLTGIRFSHEAAKKGKNRPIEFEADEPVRILVGYFNNPQKGWLQVPQLENAAQADERGGVDTVLGNAVTIDGCPSVNVHAFRYEAGRQKLELIGKGSFLILGVVPATVELTPRDAGREAAK
jgi:hypothetical protein